MSEFDTVAGEKRNKQVRSLTRKDQILQKTIIKSLMLSQEGRRYFWLELEQAHVFHQTFQPGAPDMTAFLEGRRASGLRLLNMIQAFDPMGYLKMTQENANVLIEEIKETEDE